MILFGAKVFLVSEAGVDAMNATKGDAESLKVYNVLIVGI